jgi:hypothetical protein
MTIETMKKLTEILLDDGYLVKSIDAKGAFGAYLIEVNPYKDKRDEERSSGEKSEIKARGTIQNGLTVTRLTQLAGALDSAGWNIETVDVIRDEYREARGLRLELIENPETEKA